MNTWRSFLRRISHYCFKYSSTHNSQDHFTLKLFHLQILHEISCIHHIILFFLVNLLCSLKLLVGIGNLLGPDTSWFWHGLLFYVVNELSCCPRPSSHFIKRWHLFSREYFGGSWQMKVAGLGNQGLGFTQAPSRVLQQLLLDNIGF